MQGALLDTAGDGGVLMGWPWSAQGHGVLEYSWLLSDCQVWDLQCCKDYLTLVSAYAKHLPICCDWPVEGACGARGSFCDTGTSCIAAHSTLACLWKGQQQCTCYQHLTEPTELCKNCQTSDSSLQVAQDDMKSGCVLQKPQKEEDCWVLAFPSQHQAVLCGQCPMG